jgi:hypothetical protein
MTTRPARRLTAAAGIAAFALLVSSCGGQDDPVAEPAPTSSSAAPTTSAPTSSSIVPVSAEDQAVAEATSLVKEYYAGIDRINADPNSDANDLRDVTANEAFDLESRTALQMKARGLTQIGNVRVLDVSPFSIDLSSDSTTNPPKYPTIVMDTCIDVSDVNVVDAEGKSVVSSTRPPQSAARIDLVQFDFGWRVNTIQSAGQPCTA